MKKLIFLLLCIILCSIAYKTFAMDEKDFVNIEMKCKEKITKGFIVPQIDRCENDEVFCYIYRQKGGLQCFLK